MSYEVTITIGQLKVEHVGAALRRLGAAADSLREEGLDVSITQSVERDRDGVERWHEWIDADGNVKDIQPWEEESDEAS